MTPSNLIRDFQGDFSAGGERDISPPLIDPRGFYGARNGMLADDGAVFERGGSAARSNATFGAGLRLLWDGYLGPGERTVFASETAYGVLAADGVTPIDLGGGGRSVPKPARAIEGMLFLPGGKIYGGSRKAADYSTGTVTTATGSKVVTGAGTLFAANVDAGMLFRTGAGERAYVVDSVDSNMQVTLRDAYEGSTAGGKAYSLKRLEDATAPYKSAELYALAGERLLVLSGDRIEFSQRSKPHSFLANDFHRLDEGSKIIAGESIRQNAMIFSTTGLYSIQNMTLDLVDSFGNVQQRVDLISRDLIALGAAGIGYWRNSLVVPAHDAIYIVDGANPPSPVSKAANSPYHAHIALGRIPGGAITHREHFILPMLNTDGSWADTLIWRLDRPIKSRGQTIFPWTQLLSAGAECAAFAEHLPVTGSGEAPALFGADSASGASRSRVLDLSGWFTPTGATAFDHDGNAPYFELITRDYAAPNNRLGRTRQVRILYELIGYNGGDAKIYCDIGSGIRAETPNWDEVNWDEFEWAGEGDDQFTPLDGYAEPEGGNNDYTWFSNQHSRYTRVRLRCEDAVERLVIRGVELAIAPGGAVHGRVSD